MLLSLGHYYPGEEPFTPLGNFLQIKNAAAVAENPFTNKYAIHIELIQLLPLSSSSEFLHTNSLFACQPKSVLMPVL